MKFRWSAVAGAAAAIVIGATPAMGQVADSTAPPRRPGLASWTTDRRDFKVGDIITIIVDEHTIASADMTNSDESGRSSDAGTGGSLTTAGGRSGGDVVFRGRLNNASSVRGQARRRDVLTTEISARVTEVDANGVMRIEGTRSISIDKAQQSVTIIGMVRAQDITSRNLVESWRLANAELIYASTGDLGKPKKSMLSRILGMLWP
jgi:flagellar L-ring protein precursor FlgH